jgi:hypothetical protein
MLYPAFLFMMNYINLEKLKTKNVFGQMNLYQRGMSLEVALKHQGVMYEYCLKMANLVIQN